MKLLLILDDLQQGGGAARVASLLTHAWAERGWEITILSSDPGNKPLFYTFHPAIQIRPLDLQRTSRNFILAVGNNFRRLAILRHAIQASQPDLIISFLDGNNILCLLATRGSRHPPILITERTDPHERKIGRIWEALRRMTYPWADALVTQTARALAYFPAAVQAKGTVIPNPVPVSPCRWDPAEARSRSRHTLLAVGSLRQVKGHDLLIRAFALIQNAFPDWYLRIVGEGADRSRLEALLADLGLEDRVHLPGHTTRIEEEWASADLFVLPSRAEGFPNALAEAMAAGLPVVSFDCNSGPRDLIRPEVDGLLIPPEDIQALASALARMMADAALRARLAGRASEVTQRYSVDHVLNQWDEVIGKVLGRPA